MTFELRRTNNGWLAAPERRLLRWLAPRIPRAVSPDHLTLLGLGGAALALLGYAFSRQVPAALWIVNLALLINWFGDSLDGSVARLRNISRPRYGFYLDQCTDILAQGLFALGVGISGYIRPEIVAIGFATYLMMTAQSLLYGHVSGDFHLATGGIGLTETRCLFLVVNALFYVWTPQPFDLGPLELRYSDVLGLIWSGANIALFLLAMISTLKQLAAADPPPPIAPTDPE